MHRHLLHASALLAALVQGTVEFLALQRCRFQDWLLQLVH